MIYGFTPTILDRSVCRDFEQSSKLEWLETNDTGAFAMGTVAGVNTRRYHGLLVASLHPPVRRNVTVSKIDEEVEFGGETYKLATNRFPGTLDPTGYQLLDSFHLDPFPTWTWQLGPATFRKEVLLVKGEQTAIVVYSASDDCVVRARPFLAMRQYHSLRHADNAWNQNIEHYPGDLRIQPYPEIPPLSFYHTEAEFRPDGQWFYNFEYLVELERGMDFREDLFTPGSFVFQLKANQRIFIAACIGGDQPYDMARVDELIRECRSESLVANSPFEAKLTRASNQFHAKRLDGHPTLMAGFPWFTDWGRDTMISLPGLLTTRGLLEETTEVIESFLFHVNQGLIPNHFPDFGAPVYNTCDATLWMFQAVWSYIQCGGTLAWVRDVFFPAAKEIVMWHERGTTYQIKVDPEDGLLSAGVEGTQLTWMDAKVGDWVVTPRDGKAVEVNALWYNALRMMVHWAVEFGDLDYALELRAKGDKAQENFVKKFWNPERNCLHDVIGGSGPVAKIRPNQIFAVSLPFDLLTREQQQSVVTIVEKELLTPVGLRTLERGDPEYRGRYEGDRVQRDGAYHQGTVWPWLLGPFITAYLKAFGKSAEAVQHCRAIAQGMEAQLLTDCLGTLNEIYDGDEPHTPRGCVAQAWSVAELLRVLRTDLAVEKT